MLERGYGKEYGNSTRTKNRLPYGYPVSGNVVSICNKHLHFHFYCSTVYYGKCIESTLKTNLTSDAFVCGGTGAFTHTHFGVDAALFGIEILANVATVFYPLHNLLCPHPTSFIMKPMLCIYPCFEHT